MHVQLYNQNMITNSKKIRRSGRWVKRIIFRLTPATSDRPHHSRICLKQQRARSSLGRLPVLSQRRRLLNFDPCLPDAQPHSHNTRQEADKQPGILQNLGLKGVDGFDSLTNEGLLVEDRAEAEEVGCGDGVGRWLRLVHAALKAKDGVAKSCFLGRIEAAGVGVTEGGCTGDGRCVVEEFALHDWWNVSI